MAAKKTAKTKKDKTPTGNVIGFNKSFVALTRLGISGPESVFVNPTNVAWVEKSATTVAVPEQETGSTLYMTGQPAIPLYVTEPVATVLSKLTEAT
mgnify:CR=1 FL=1